MSVKAKKSLNGGIYTNRVTKEKIEQALGYTPANINHVPSLKNGTAIPQGSDLNTYIELGNFKCTSRSVVATLSNCPTNQAFEMKVGNDVLLDGGKYKYQEIVDVNGDRYWRYTGDDGEVWFEWRTNFDSSTIIPTANGGFGTDMSFDIGDKEHLERVDDFVTEMNRIAQNIGMTSTTVKTPSGYCRKPVNESKNTLSTTYNSHTTAKDALRLLIAARHTLTVAKAIGTEKHLFVYNYDINGTVFHSVLANEDWKAWAKNKNFTILGAKGGSLTGDYGEKGPNGILNMTMLIEDANGDVYGVTVLGLDYIKATKEEVPLLRTLIADLVNEAKGSATTEAVTSAKGRSEYPVCMAAVKLTKNGTFEDDIAMLDNGIYHNGDKVIVAASVIKMLVAITAVSRMSNQYASVNKDDLVGGSCVETLAVAGTVVTTFDALHIMLLASDNNMATLLARVYGK